jgi:hypothetical protein
MNRLAGLADAAGTCSHRQTRLQTPVDYRVISDHMPITPFLPEGGAVTCS